MWNISYSHDHHIIYKVQEQSSSTQPLIISHSLTVKSDLSWSLSIYGQPVSSQCSALAESPDNFNCRELCNFLHKLDSLTICPGHPDKHFVKMVATKGGNILSPSGGVSAYLDTTGIFELNGEMHCETVRSGKCHRLVKGAKCTECAEYRDRLRANYHNWLKQKSKTPSMITSTHSHTNERWLTTAQKEEKSSKLKMRLRASNKKITYLKNRIEELHDNMAITVDDNLHSGLIQIMDSHTMEIKRKYQENSFHHLFWTQQLNNLHKYPTQRRWHPMLIRWCLHLRMLSGSAYDALHHILVLPTDRTLRDYTHFIKSGTGIQAEVTQQLISETNFYNLEEWQKFVEVIFDEMKIKEGLVYDKHECKIKGFVDLGDINNHLMTFEKSITETINDDSSTNTFPVAKQMLTFMVRGIFIKLNFPYAQYPTVGITAEQLFPIAWEIVRNLETAGFKVMSLTGDGSSANHKFFRLHNKSVGGNSKVVNKVPNPYSKDKRCLYFFVDVPHLLKTVRNCWSNSFGHNHARALWVSSFLNYSLHACVVHIAASTQYLP